MCKAKNDICDANDEANITTDDDLGIKMLDCMLSLSKNITKYPVKIKNDYGFFMDCIKYSIRMQLGTFSFHDGYIVIQNIDTTQVNQIKYNISNTNGRHIKTPVTRDLVLLVRDAVIDNETLTLAALANRFDIALNTVAMIMRGSYNHILDAGDITPDNINRHVRRNAAEYARVSQSVYTLRDSGVSVRDIANKLDISETHVRNMLRSKNCVRKT